MNMEFDTVEFSRQHFAACGTFTRESFRCHTNEVLMHHMEALAINLECEVLSKDYGSRTHVFKYQHPITWWDCFKKDVLPAWISRNLKPVKWQDVEQEVTFDFHACFPEADISIPRDDRLGPVRWRVASRPDDMILSV